MNYQTSPKISVVIRKRPLSRREITRSDFDIVDISTN